MGQIEVVEETIEVLKEYSSISIAFEVRSMLEVTVLEDGLHGFLLKERAVDPPWIKDYDSIEDEGSTSWARRWDIANWGVLAAYDQGQRAGGCVLAYDTPGVYFLESRKDLAALWDIRVAPELRGRGIGKELFSRAVSWSRTRGCNQLKIETQNINVPACRFYRAQGCTLRSIDRDKYAGHPDEVEMVWHKTL